MATKILSSMVVATTSHHTLQVSMTAGMVTPAEAGTVKLPCLQNLIGGGPFQCPQGVPSIVRLDQCTVKSGCVELTEVLFKFIACIPNESSSYALAKEDC